MSPAVPSSRKRAVLATLTAPLALDLYLRNFLFVVIDHRRIAEFSSILEGFDEMLDGQLGIVRADVQSAFELSGSQRQSLEAQLSRLSGKRVRMRFSLDPALIGGVVARVGPVTYDGSVRGQLENLRQKLAAAE
jgi:F-type H+-transporting ATPase subunit delta